jgi:hypothetical protein
MGKVSHRKKKKSVTFAKKIMIWTQQKVSTKICAQKQYSIFVTMILYILKKTIGFSEGDDKDWQIKYFKKNPVINADAMLEFAEED